MLNLPRIRRTAACVALVTLHVIGTEPSAADQQVEASSGPAEAKVVQVFTAEDDGHRFVAYLVEWKGHRVIVSDPLARSDAKVGDTIRFHVHRHSVGSGDREQALLRFTSLGSRVDLDAEGNSRSIDKEKRSWRLVQGDLTAARDDEERFIALGKAARNAYDAGDTDLAKQLAEELAELTPKNRGSWNYGNAVQNSNQVLGLIALKYGDTPEAKRRLLASADSDGSPQMNSFGPNMQLAKALLAAGERDVVLEYFDACAGFWEMGDEKLADWGETVQQGGTPDFGANLDY